MVQPSVYSYEQIIQAAFELIREKGWSSISARAIAKKLGSSTMPIYSHVKSVDELENELRKQARKLLKEYQKRKYTDQILLNIAFGYVVFARDEKNLFRFLYLDKPEQINLEGMSIMKEAFLSEFGPDSPEAAELLQMNQAGLDPMIRYSWIFTHGLAMLVNSGSMETDDDKEILTMLMDAGEAFYILGISRQERRKQENGGEKNDA